MKKIKKAAAIAASAGTVAVGGLFILKNAADKKRFVSWGEKKESKSGTVKDFKITSPYAEVDWDSWLSLKGNLHTHSTASDAGVDFADMIEAFYKQDFDILCMTDHGVINHGGTSRRKELFSAFNPISKSPDICLMRDITKFSQGLTEAAGACSM